MRENHGLCLFLAFLIATPARAGLRFSCTDASATYPHKAFLTGEILDGFERHSFGVRAAMDTLYLYEDEKVTAQDVLVGLKGEGFITATGCHQFDLQSSGKNRLGPISLQLSLKNGADVVYSYLTVGQVRYRTICGVAKRFSLHFAKH